MPIPAPSPSGVHAVDVVAHYNYPSSLDGSGQTIALLAIGGEYRSDELQLYCAASGIPVPRVTDTAIAGADAFSDEGFDVALARDLQLIAAAAPGAEVALYRAPGNDLGILSAFEAALQSGATVACVTWATAEASTLTLALERSLQQAAMTGVTVCAAADPTLATYDGKPSAPYPATSPYVLACGPTRAVVAGPGAADEAPVKRAADWHAAMASQQLDAGPWQAKSIGQRASRRLIPDVTCLGDDAYGYRVYARGRWLTVGGAGASACLWAGLNARLVQGVGRRLGLWTPYLYERLGPAGVLRSPSGAATHAGQRRWQQAVGWGSPDGDRLLGAMKSF